MKRLNLLIAVFMLISSYSFASGKESENNIDKEDTNDIQILFVSKEYDVGADDFEGYVIKENELYINLAMYVEKPFSEKHIFKYEKGKLVDMKLSETEIEKYFEEAKPTYDHDSENKIIIDEKRYIKLGNTGSPRITLIEGKKEKYLRGYVFSTPRLTYMYLDRKNEKLYFAGGTVGEGGIMKYDIKTGKPEVLKRRVIYNHTEDVYGDSERFFNPIRVPNEPCLLFFIEKRINKKYFYEIAIKEVVEWKEEIERQEKNKKENPQAKEAYTNGSENDRDKPKVKLISTLNDWTEVLILEQENDWYHIIYADIEGWTYKDNIRQEKK
jgi:hypothetical protein